MYYIRYMRFYYQLKIQKKKQCLMNVIINKTMTLLRKFSRFWLSCLCHWFFVPKFFSVFQCFYVDLTWWRLLLKRVMRTKFYIYFSLITHRNIAKIATWILHRMITRDLFSIQGVGVRLSEYKNKYSTNRIPQRLLCCFILSIYLLVVRRVWRYHRGNQNP